MTEQQASKIRSCFSNGVPYVELYTKNTDELATLMDEAIKKQIPQKAILSEQQNVRYVTKYECPICHREFLMQVNYCFACGQKLHFEEQNQQKEGNKSEA